MSILGDELDIEQLDFLHYARANKITEVFYVKRGVNNNDEEYGSFYAFFDEQIACLNVYISKIFKLRNYNKVYYGDTHFYCSVVLLLLPAETVIRNLSELMYNDWDKIKFHFLE